MAYSPTSLGIVSQIGQRALEKQGIKRKKSNTITVAIGAVITTVVSLLTYLMEANVEWLPSWTILAVTVLGYLGTVLGVSQTKNGLTESSLGQIEDVINEMVEEQSRDKSPHFPKVSLPSSEEITGAVSGTADRIADELEALARRVAERR